MKKIYILVAVVFSCFVFCTKSNPTQTTVTSVYKDSIILDLFSYNVYVFDNNTTYNVSATLSPKGKGYLKSLDSLVHSYYDSANGYSLVGVVAPKYEPTEFEAWVYDSMALTTSDSSDPNLLITVLSHSENNYYALDTSAINSDKSIQPLPIRYDYGYGFVLGGIVPGGVPNGIGKIKIYYR